MLTTAYVAVVVVVLLITGWLAIIGWRQRAYAGARPFLALAVCVAAIVTTELLSLLAPTPALAHLWFSTRYLLLSLSAVFGLIMALEIGGRGHWVTRAVRGGLFALPLALLVVQATNVWHGLWLRHDVSFTFVAPFWLADITTRVGSIGFLLHVFYTGALAFLSAVFLSHYLWRHRRSGTYPILILFVISWIGLGLLYASAFGIVFLQHFNPMMFGLALNTLLLGIAAQRHALFRQARATPDTSDRFPGWLLLVFPWVVAAIGASATYTYQDYVARFQVEVERQLLSVAKLKVDDIIAWRKERLRDATLLEGNHAFIRLVRDGYGPMQDAAAKADLSDWLINIQSPEEYVSVLLLDPHGEPLVTVPATGVSIPDDIRTAARTLSPASTVGFIDLHRHEQEGTIQFSVVIPILDLDAGSRPLALLVLQIDPNVHLYPYLQTWPYATTSAETYLVRREESEVVYLNTLRFLEQPPLTLRFPISETWRPAVQAALGHTGIWYGTDYAGTPIISAVYAVPDSPWFLVARIERAEAFAPLQNRGWQFALTLIALLAAAWAGFDSLRRQALVQAYAIRLSATEALRKSEERFRTLVEQAPTAIFIQTNERFTYANFAALSLYGFDRLDQLMGKRIVDHVHPDDRAQVTERIRQLNHQRQAVPIREQRIVRADGTITSVEVSAVPYEWDGESGALVFLHDLTPRKQAEAAYQASEERYRLLFETSIDGILLTATDGVVFSANPAACKLLGRSEAEIIQVGRGGLVDATDPRLAIALEERRRTGKYHGEITMLRGDGAPIPVEISTTVYQEADGVAYTSIILRDISERKRAEETLKRSEIALQMAQQIAHVGSWSWHIPTARLEWSHEMYRIFGIDRENFQGDLRDAIFQRIHPEDVAAVRVSGDMLRRGEPPPSFEYRVIQPDGNLRHVYAESGAVLYDEAGAPWMLTGIVQDITERKLIEDALREGEARYRNLLDLAPVGIVVHAAGEILYINPTAVRALGAASPDELIGRPVIDFVHPDIRAEVQARVINLLMDAAEPTPVEETYVRLDGAPIHVQVMASVLTYQGRRAVQAVMTDITAQKEAQDQLRLQSAALEAAANAILITDHDGVIKWANPAFTALTGYTLAESIARTPRDLVFSGFQGEEFYRRMWDSILSGETWRGQLVNRRKDGTLYDEEMTITPVIGYRGQITHFVAIKQDISARIRHERELTVIASVSAALRHVRTRAETVTGTLEQLCNLLQVEGAAIGTVDLASGELTIETGYGKWSSVTGMRIPRGAGAIGAILDGHQGYLNNQVQEHAGLMQLDFVRDCNALAGVPMLVDEQLIGLLWVGSARRLTEEDMKLLGSIADIAATALHREALHDQLQAQARQLAQVMETVPQGLLVFDAQGEILLANPAAKRLLPNLTGKPKDTGPHPLTQLGDRSLAELLTSPPKGLRHEIHTGDRIVEVLARPISNGPAAEQWVMLLDDVTQARQVQTQLQLQERLATVGQLAAGIAHDFNNIMAVIILYTELAARNRDVPARERERLMTIDEQARRASALIRQILDFSRQSFLERRPLDLLVLIKEQVKLLERTLPESIATVLDVTPGDYTISADPTRMQQIVMNLAINARDAMPNGGTLTFELAQISVERGQSPVLPEMAPGAWVRLTVRDTGSGIPPEVLPHIFDPFFTTKAPGKGSGLGLAQVHGIVSQHEGRIDVVSQAGQGTAITIHLPASSDGVPETPELPPTGTLHGQGERVLLVEDEPAVRTALAEILQGLNYTVTEATNGQEALACLAEADADVAVVLTDLVMPVLGGIPLVHNLRRQGWNMPVVLMTGHPLETDLEGLDSLGVSACLLKPLQTRQLAVALHDALSLFRQTATGALAPTEE